LIEFQYLVGHEWTGHWQAPGILFFFRSIPDPRH
jgi:hypothetical protein